MDTHSVDRPHRVEAESGDVMARGRSPQRRRFRRKRVFLAVAPLLAVVVLLGLAWFEPWKLWTNTTVNEDDVGTGAVVVAQGTCLNGLSYFT